MGDRREGPARRDRPRGQERYRDRPDGPAGGRLGRLDLDGLTARYAWARERVTAYRDRRRAALARLTPTQRRWHRARLIGLGGLGLFVVAPTLVFFLGYLFFSIPTPDDAVNKQVATISFADNTELARIVPDEGNRTKISIGQVPKHVQYAVLAAEDRSFFSNPGFDPIGIARAAWKQLTGGGGGGSTITQQYVKKTLIGDEYSLWRKYKEMVIAVKISQQSRKEDILADYLNAIYFGRGAYGIQSASQAYFGKNVGDLTPSEGALLAGVIQSPNRWDPAISPQRASQRWNFVIAGMASEGWLTPQQSAEARFPVPVPKQKIAGGTPSDYRGLIVNAIRDELEQRGISDQEFDQEGLEIATTIDPTTQQRAVDAAHRSLAGEPADLRSALVSIDPRTGAVLAYYGGDNGIGLDYARVSKQPGSTFKPFVLLAALQRPDPIGLGTTFKGEPLPGLRNADGASCQLCDLKQAMTISNNVIYDALARQVTPGKVAAAARQAGITSPLTEVDARIALGNKEVTPVELASAYATFAAGGVYHPPHLVSKVTTSDNRVLYEAVIPQEQRFSAQVARNVTEAMLGVPAYDRLTLPGGRQVAAKTGTVQSSRIEGQNNDAWIAGYTPQVATAVWIGTDQNSPIRTAKGTPITGASLPGTIWKSFMTDTTRSQPEQSFGPFKAIGSPPSAAGPGEGYTAPSGPSQAPAPPSGVPVPDAPAASVGPVPGEPSARPPSQRDCGLLRCRSAQSERDEAPPGDTRQPPDGLPEAQPVPSDAPDAAPGPGRPVRG